MNYKDINEFNLLDHIAGKTNEYTVIWLFNIGVEKFWNGDISTVKNLKEDIVVNHIEEICLLLTKVRDVLILRNNPNEKYLEEMKKRGFEIPMILTPQDQNESLGISELVLQDKFLLNQLKELSKNRKKVVFVPYGVSVLEEKIAQICQLEMIGGPSKISQKINNKFFARKVAEELHYSITQGTICDNLDELKEKGMAFLNVFEKVIIKQPCGASGKGLYIIDSERKLISVIQILKHISRKSEINQGWIVERWYEKQADINYQIYIGQSGLVKTFSVKEQLLDKTVYIGSIIPPRLSDSLVKKCEECGKQIGKLLYQNGYNGIVGIDAMVTKENDFIPIIEINARFTLSTYLSFLDSYRNSKQILFFYEKIFIEENVNYQMILNELKKWNEKNPDQESFCCVSETVNGETVKKNGRLFILQTMSALSDGQKNYEKICELWRNKKW